MHHIHTACLVALCLCACSDARTPPRTDGAAPASTPTADTGSGGSAPAAVPSISQLDDGRRITGLARWPGEPTTDTQEALLDGTLVAADGCLYVVPATGPRYAVIWAAHVELDDAAAPTRVIDRRSGQSAAVGGPVRLGGGEVPGARTAALDASLPPGCRGDLWIASGIVARGG